jgi:nucleotide-binding universal stress UspA family protein
MQERILVPLDGSEAGESVLAKVEDLLLRATPKMDAEVTFLKVISKMNFNMLTEDEAAQLPQSAEEVSQLTQDAQSYLEKVAEGFKAKGIKVKTVVTFGNAANEIVRVARESKAHLIAMSNTNHSGIVHWAIGSTTDKVMRLEGKIPVMAVDASGKKTEKPTASLESLRSAVKKT